MKPHNQFEIIFFALNLVFLSTVSALAEEVTTTQSSANRSLSTSSSTFFTKEKWGVNYFNYMNGPTFSESTGGSINHYLTLKHKFNPEWALSAVLRPDLNFGNENSFLTSGDPYVRLEYPAIYRGKSDLKVTGDVRYYAPVSEGSSKSKILGVVSTFVKASMDVNRLSFLYVLIPKIYINTLSADGQKTASHGHYAATSYKLSPKVNLDFALYPVWTLNRNQAVAFNDLPAYPGFTVNFSEALSVSPYMEIPLLQAERKTMSVGGTLSYTFL